MKPGDVIHWVNCISGEPCDRFEVVWSTVSHSWVPVGSRLHHLLIAHDGKKKIVWLNSLGLWRTRIVDQSLDAYPSERIEPRVQQ